MRRCRHVVAMRHVMLDAAIILRRLPPRRFRRTPAYRRSRHTVAALRCHR